MKLFFKSSKYQFMINDTTLSYWRVSHQKLQNELLQNIVICAYPKKK